MACVMLMPPNMVLPVRIARLAQTFWRRCCTDDNRVVRTVARISFMARDIVLLRVASCAATVAADGCIKRHLISVVEGKDGGAYNGE